MNDHVNGQKPEAEASVYIDDSRQALEERLELCMLRTGSYTGETVPPAMKGFLDASFAMLKNAAGQETFWQGTVEDDTLCKLISTSDEDLCKQKDLLGYELCKLNISENSELCKLEQFWLLELKGLIPLEKGGSLTDLVICWETTLQLLLEAELAFGEERLPEVKEWKDILYSYVYDYAAELIGEAKARDAEGKALGASFITELAAQICQEQQDIEDFMAGCPYQVRLGLEQFLGDRLKARLIEISQTTDRDVATQVKLHDRDVATQVKLHDRDVATQAKMTRQETSLPCDTKMTRQETSLPCENCMTRNVPPMRIALSAHQRKTLAELLKKAGTMALMVLMCLALSACGKEKKEAEMEETTAAAAQEYPGMVAYKAPESDQTEYFGVMHATVLDVQAGEKDGLFVYTLRDEEDPENAWCLNSQNVGSIFCDVTGGKRVAVLFYGDIVNNPDEVEFIAILDDAPYQIKWTEGTTTQNMMNSFVVHTTKGKDLTFIKDNCKVDKEALSTDGSVSIRVYYADCNSGDLYPVRVYRQPGTKR